ncbi:Bifunctional protein GlmU [Sulfitobacter sp. THAF37]|uniref:nucleotidyltransferase family protein n=1 Tax=Sulfitobacter sp. THAF37 TaxID=2587855 RepID=UPI00126893A7|nr:nucleotidyltransferase family protein [Sulfitobacter sp. THAF37]QFT58283.1 Bifunctional protein GlmU [Sulfitobacter sp. THAF37]
MTALPLMLFAAGFGTRMKPLTDDRPKPLIQVAGKPLVDHALALGRDAGCAPIVANLHYKAEQLERHLAGTEVITLREQPDILDTGGGLRNAGPTLGQDTVVTMNTDAIWAGPNPINLLRQAWKPEQMDALLIAIPLQQARGYDGAGDFTLEPDGRLTRGPGLLFGGVQIVKTTLLPQIPERVFSLNRLWDMMHERGRLFGLRYPGSWCDVGHPAGIGVAEDMLAAAGV